MGYRFIGLAMKHLSNAAKLILHRNLLRISVLIFFLQSCAGIPFQSQVKVGPDLQERLSKGGMMLPNKVSDVHSYHRRTLWNVLHARGIHMDPDSSLADSSLLIQVEKIGERNLLFQLRNNETILLSRKVTGRWQDQWFVSRNRIRFVGLPLIYFLLSERRWRMGLSGDGRLLVEAAAGKLGMILVLHAGPVWNETYCFDIQNH